VTGFGLVQALAPIDLDPLPLGLGASPIGDPWWWRRRRRRRSVASHHARPSRRFARLLGIFGLMRRSHLSGPSELGAAPVLISNRGELIGIGSLQLERERGRQGEHVNMVVPIDLLKPVLDDLRKFGRVNKPARPGSGCIRPRSINRVVVVGISAKDRRRAPKLKAGDVILAVKGEKISSQTGSIESSGRLDLPAWMYRLPSTTKASPSTWC